MALVSDQGNSVAAKKVLLTLWDYMSTPDQIKRMQDVISNPKRLDGVPGQMNVVHIRFDSNSPVMADVQEEGKPQLWNHKQNDALGLYLDLLIQAIDTDTINAEDWQKGDRLKSVALLIAYLDKANFYVMEDSGAWEEDARLNTSSVALVTSGLERLSNLLSGFAPIFPDICYHLTHYKPAAADIPVASDNPAHYADAIRYNARTPLQGSLLPLTRLVWA